MDMRALAKYLATAAVLPIAITAGSPAQSTAPATKSVATFNQLKSLVGEWKAVQDGVPVKETYTLTANGTTLMAETRPGNEPAMITMFTIDGDRLVAKHYCIAGNQPEMVSSNPNNLQKGVTFNLARVTGMKTPDDWHNTGVIITLDDPNHMTQRWTYLYKGETGSNVLRYTRQR
jgi:hypothetical protein